MSNRPELVYGALQLISDATMVDQESRDFRANARDPLRQDATWQEIVRKYIRRWDPLLAMHLLTAAGYNNLACAYAWDTGSFNNYPRRSQVDTLLKEGLKIAKLQEEVKILRANLRLISDPGFGLQPVGTAEEPIDLPVDRGGQEVVRLPVDRGKIPLPRDAARLGYEKDGEDLFGGSVETFGGERSVDLSRYRARTYSSALDEAASIGSEQRSTRPVDDVGGYVIRDSSGGGISSTGDLSGVGGDDASYTDFGRGHNDR